EVAALRIVDPDERPARGGPQVPVRVDEPRHADHAAAVERLRAARGEALRHRYDRAVAHVHVAALEVAELRIHGEYGGAADKEFSAGRQRLRRTARAGCLGEEARWGHAGRGEAQCKLESRPTIHRMPIHEILLPQNDR